MACATCEERAKLLREARDAFNRGDVAETERVLKEVFGSVKLDLSKLSAALFHPIAMKVGERISLLKQTAEADPNTERAHLGGSGRLPDKHMHGPDSKCDPKVS